jgi:hypothetical protein
MDESRERERRWLRRHALFAPFGVFAATLLLLVRSGQWSGWENLESAAKLVDLGAVMYSMVAVLAERGVDLVFWALEQRKKRIEERKAEGRAEERAKIKAHLERVSREEGIPLERLLPGEEDAK